jgi:hypothetical protein
MFDVARIALASTETHSRSSIWGRDVWNDHAGDLSIVGAMLISLFCPHKILSVNAGNKQCRRPACQVHSLAARAVSEMVAVFVV